MGTEVVRGEEYGTPAQRARATSITKDGVTQRVVRDRHGRLVGLEGPSRADALQEAIDGLAVDSAELEDRLLAAEGWRSLGEVGLMLNTENLCALCVKFEIVGPPKVRLKWAPRDDADGWFRRDTDEDVIFCNPELPVERINYVLAHELWHCSQARRIGNGWANAVRDAYDELEAEAREQADAVEHIELVRRL
jgi:hypothetical protein